MKILDEAFELLKQIVLELKEIKILLIETNSLLMDMGLEKFRKKHD